MEPDPMRRTPLVDRVPVARCARGFARRACRTRKVRILNGPPMRQTNWPARRSTPSSCARTSTPRRPAIRVGWRPRSTPSRSWLPAKTRACRCRKSHPSLWPGCFD